MRTLLFILIASCILSSASAQDAYVAGHLLIAFKKEIKHGDPKKGSTITRIEAIDKLNAVYGCKNIRTVMSVTKGYGGIYLLQFDPTADIPQLQNAYMATGLLRYAEPDYIANIGAAIPPNDTLFGRQWSLNNDGSFALATTKAGADIDMLRAWDVEDGDTAVIMGIIDSGLKMDHPDFAGRLWTNYNEIPGNGIDDDNNGYIDDINGWNTATDTNYLADDNGHGTNVTGIIAANSDNTTGYAGIDRHCKLMICKVANAAGTIDYAWLAEGIYYAIDNGARIINISAGGYWGSGAFADAADYAYTHDVTIVAAMGNNHSSSPFYPAGCAHVIAVGATGPTDKVAAFSNFGSHISVTAPGEYIYGPSNLYDTSYGLWYSGTSQASPHVAGIAALLLSQNKNRKPDDIRMLIETNAEDRVGDTLDVPGWDKYYGHGRVNAYRALTNEALTVKNTTFNNPNATLYPNPATDKIYVTTTVAAALSITDAAGVLITRQEKKTGTQCIALPPLCNGVYYMHVSNGNGQETTSFSIMH